MKTLIALIIAIRNLWLLCLAVMVLLLLDPGWGIYDYAVNAAGGQDRLLRGSLALALSGILTEHLLGALTRRRQGALARALLRLQPGLQHIGAIRILIRALEASDPDVIESVQKELVRLTGKDFGPDPQAWRQWVQRLEKISAGKLESAEQVRDKSTTDGEQQN